MIYVILAPQSNLMKIGVSIDPEKRLQALRVGFPYPLEILYVVPDASYKEERKIHWELRKYRQQGEWFDVTDESMKLLQDVLRKYPFFDAKGWRARIERPSVLRFPGA